MTHRVTEEQIFEAPTTFRILSTKVVSTLVGTTPSVENCEVFRCSGAVVTVTNFTKGTSNQSIAILGDGNTTISNNANIKTNTGANKLLAANKVYRFTYISNVWYEDA